MTVVRRALACPWSWLLLLPSPPGLSRTRWVAGASSTELAAEVPGATECQNHQQLRSSWHWRWEVGLVWVPSPSDPGICLASPSPVSVAVGTTRVPSEASCCSVRLTCPGTIFSTASLSHLAHFPLSDLPAACSVPFVPEVVTPPCVHLPLGRVSIQLVPCPEKVGSWRLEQGPQTQEAAASPSGPGCAATRLLERAKPVTY